MRATEVETLAKPGHLLNVFQHPRPQDPEQTTYRSRAV